MSAKKNKPLYDGYKAIVDRINCKEVVMIITEGPCKKSKRKCLFSTVTLVKKKRAEPPAAAIPEAPAVTTNQGQKDLSSHQPKPDQECMDMFGDLGMFGTAPDGPDGQL